MAEKPEEEPLDVRVQLLLSKSTTEAVDVWGFARRIRSRNEVIRQLIELGLEASAEKEQR